MALNKKTVIISLAVVCCAIILATLIYNSYSMQPPPSMPNPIASTSQDPTSTPSSGTQAASPSPTASSNIDSITLSTKEKGLLFLNMVVGLDTSKYNVTTEENQGPGLRGEPSRDCVSYKFQTDTAHVTAIVEFTFGKIQFASIVNFEGPLYLTKTPSSTKDADLAKTFLQNYKTFTNDPIYGEIAATLDSLNENQIRGNIRLASSGESFKWYYTANGVDAEYTKFLGIGFRNGFLHMFVDKWQLYAIGNTSVNISEHQAKAIALDTTKNYNWTVVDSAAFEPKSFNETNVKWTALFFIGSLDTDKTHPGGELTLYPVWRVGVALDKWYGNMYGLEVEIWADNGEIRSTETAWSMMEPYR